MTQINILNHKAELAFSSTSPVLCFLLSFLSPLLQVPLETAKTILSMRLILGMFYVACEGKWAQS